jgi:hypothetical protein
MIYRLLDSDRGLKSYLHTVFVLLAISAINLPQNISWRSKIPIVTDQTSLSLQLFLEYNNYFVCPLAVAKSTHPLRFKTARKFPCWEEEDASA